MLLRAATELDLDIARSWMVGDMLSDVLAGKNAGVAHTIHVKTGHGKDQVEAHAAADFAADDLAHAARIILLQHAGDDPRKLQ
jgi:D-glycero-D-manno-heptose 1,7-bisphosphate phosphatase